MAEEHGSSQARVIGVRSVLLAVTGMLLALLVFYQAMVFRGYEPVSGDSAATESHARWSKARLAADGETPLWYPDIFLGMPSYGSFIYTPGSPLSWLHRNLDMNRGTRYVLWFLIGSIGTVLMVRRFGASGTAAFVAAAAVIFTPYVIGSLNAGHSSKLMAMAFAPLVFWSVDRLTSGGGILGVGIAALAIALQLWANHPQIVFYTWLVVGPYALTNLIMQRDRAAVGRGLLLACALAIACLMVALPYLPVYDYAAHSTRGAPSVLPGAAASGTQSWDYATLWSFDPRELVSFVVPGFFGLEGATYWGYMPFTQSSHALGTIPLLLAVAGFFAMRGWPRVFFLVLAGAFLIIGFGRHFPILYRPLYELAPFFDKFRVPSMIYSLLPLVAAPAIVIGFDRLASGDRRLDRLVVVLLVAMGVMLLAGLLFLGGAAENARPGWLLKSGEQPNPTLIAERHAILGHDLFRVGLLGTLAMLAARLRGRGTLPRMPFAIAIVGLLLVDLTTLGRAFYDPEPKSVASDLGPSPDVVEMLLVDEGPVRVLPLELSVRGGRLVPDLLEGSEYGVAGIQSVGGYHAAGLRRMKDFILAGLWGNPALWPMLGAEFLTVHLRARLSDDQRAQLRENVVAQFGELELIGEHAGTGGEVFVLRNPGNLGRVFMVPRARLVPDALERIDALGSPDFDPAAEVLIETPVPAPVDPGPDWQAHATLVSYADERVEVETDGDGGFLVVAGAYHEGWHATIDGETALVLPANHVLRAVAVPPGDHRIVMTFQDAAFETARGLSLAGKTLCGLCLLAGVVIGWRSRGETGGA